MAATFTFSPSALLDSFKPTAPTPSSTTLISKVHLSGIRRVAPKDVILNNLALSDVDLQDLIASAVDGVKSEVRKDEKGQVYYVHEINGVSAHSLISVTRANNKLYAHFVNAPTAEWKWDQDVLRHVNESFKTIG